ncbi:MAG: hypothetical protein LBP91_03760, partial [Coriobacteriales bacterium]|nr:hypothetical protein [Coriobacteriales bacterium]
MGDIDPRISPLQADVDGLTNTLEERDRFIQKLSDDLVLQKNKTLELEAQLAEKEAALLPSDAETSRRTIRSSALLGESALDFSKSREEIEQLELALKDSLSESQKNTALVSEMSGLRLDRDLATNQLALQTTELASVKSQLQSIQMVNEDLAARLLRETQAASAATTALDVIKQR